MSNRTDDIYFKKRIRYSLHRHTFLFDTAELLFSTYDVDIGTQFLLRRIPTNLSNIRSILDLGCGYGVIGIVLARLYPQAQVLLSDKDLLAIRYTRYNLQLNNTSNATAVGSIGIRNLPQHTFDMIASNIPGHIGERAIEQDFILGPVRLLNPDGAYWFVIVSPLSDLIHAIGEEHHLPLREIDKRSGHVVFKIEKESL